MDGHRDTLIEKGFIVTKSIRTFLNDKHSIIVGSYGTGKSAIFQLMKLRSSRLDIYKNDLIVSIDEQIQFDQLKKDSSTYFPNLDPKLTFQLIWKFQVCRRISEELSKLPDFPNNKNEKYISEFIKRTGGIGGHVSILSRLKGLFGKISFKLKAKLSEIPVDVEVSNNANKILPQIELNLEQVIENISSIIDDRKFRQATIIIDKLDKFVSGEEYDTQRSYIESLLELEDDLFPIKSIGFKIFIRLDLYERLDFSSLGPDKVEDNTLKLEWSTKEIRSFVSKRLFIALNEKDVWNLKDVIESSNLSNHYLKWYEKALISGKKDGLLFKLANIYISSFGRSVAKNSLYEELDLKILEKLFCSPLPHENDNGKVKQITIKNFFDTHFLDGNDSCTPRYMLVFLKELVEETSHFYNRSPNMILPVIQSGGDSNYNLFPTRIIYKSYIVSKDKYIRHVSKVDDRWTAYILDFLAKKGKKTTFDYKWIKNNLSFDDDISNDAYNFLVFLKVIGFLKEKKYSIDLKKRQFELPILYLKEQGAVEI